MRDSVPPGLAEAEAAGEQDTPSRTSSGPSSGGCPTVWDHRAKSSHQMPSNMPNMETTPGRTWRSRILYSSAPTGCIGGLPKTESQQRTSCLCPRAWASSAQQKPRQLAGTAHRKIHSHGSRLLEQQGKGYISGNTAAHQRDNYC